jgi:HEAT repeat protein
MSWSSKSVLVGIVIAMAFFCSCGSAELKKLRTEMKSDDVDVRAEAVRRYGQLARHRVVASDEAVETLLPHTKDSDDWVRGLAYSALEAIDEDSERAVATLVDALSDPSVVVRRVGAMGLYLRRKETSGVIPSLLQAMLDEDLQVRSQVATALAAHGDKVEFVPPDSWSELTSEEALKELESFGVEASEEELIKAAMRGDVAVVILHFKAGFDPGNVRAGRDKQEIIKLHHTVVHAIKEAASSSQ